MYEVFPDFEGACYYVQVTEHAVHELDVAREAAAVEAGTSPDLLELTPVWMCEVEGDDAMEVSGGEFDFCWKECPEDREGATPYYKAVEV